MNRDDGVLAVEIARQRRPDLGGIEVARELAEATRQVGPDVLALTRPVDEDAEIVGLPPKRFRERAIGLEPPPALQDLLGVGLVLPEVGCGGLRLEFGQLAIESGFVKAPSAHRRRGPRDPRTRERARRRSEP